MQDLGKRVIHSCIEPLVARLRDIGILCLFGDKGSLSGAALL